ncbi:hypothetical protein BJV74DRAFT_831230 [Russula compacta]|nr:hypothetical protein BJV74DRAFT_831230 [Russula compacta]
MEALSLTCVPNAPSFESPKKRTSSPGAPTPHRKKPKMDPGHSNRDKRKRKKKKRPITRDSGTMLGLVQNVRSSSPALGPPFPSASSSTENRSSSFVPPQSDGPSGSSSAPLPPVRSPSVAGALSQEAAHALLQQERVIPTLPSTSKSLHDHKVLLASLISSLVCQICLDLLHKPFALSPCGHVSCYCCLVNWFNADHEPDGLEGRRVFRKKTCPQCRAIVCGRPIEVWNVKDMVATVVKSKLAQDFTQPVELNPEVTPADSATPPQDPWGDLFPPVLLRPGTPLEDLPPDALGMYDTEDQVHRCLDCMHEIREGSCTQCGRHYSGHDVGASDDDASGEGRHGIWSILPVMEHMMGWPHSVSADESDDGSYEASFIDDEDLECHDSEAVESSSDDNIIEATALAMRQDRDGVQSTSSEGCNDGDEKLGDIGDTGESQAVRQRPAVRTRRQVLSDTDVDHSGSYNVESDDDGSLARPPMRLFGRLCDHHLDSRGIDSRFSESDDSDNVGSDAFGSHWSGEEPRTFFAGVVAEEDSDADADEDEDEGW